MELNFISTISRFVKERFPNNELENKDYIEEGKTLNEKFEQRILDGKNMVEKLKIKMQQFLKEEKKTLKQILLESKNNPKNINKLLKNLLSNIDFQKSPLNNNLLSHEINQLINEQYIQELNIEQTKLDTPLTPQQPQDHGSQPEFSFKN